MVSQIFKIYFVKESSGVTFADITNILLIKIYTRGLKSSNFIQKRLQHRPFSVKCPKCLRTLFFIEHLLWLLLTCGKFFLILVIISFVNTDNNRVKTCIKKVDKKAKIGQVVSADQRIKLVLPYVGKWLHEKAMVNFKIYVTDWTTNNYNTNFSTTFWLLFFFKENITHVIFY